MGEPFEKMVESASRGDAAAVDDLLERYLPGLHGFVRLRAGGRLLDRESTSDLVQSVCREVLQHIDRFQHGGEVGFKYWLYRTAERKIADRYEYYRAAKRDLDREVTGGAPGSGRTGPDALLDCYRSFCTPSGQAIVNEELERIEKAFAALGDDQREVILLSRMIGLPRSEVAAKMGRSEGSVRMLLSRALAAFAEQLDR